MQQPQGEHALPPDTLLTAIGLAHRCVDSWLADATRSGAAQRGATDRDGLRQCTIGRVQSVLQHEMPAAANRRWLCDTVRAWAPLEVLFPSRSSREKSGVTGELSGYLNLIVEREYGHISAGLRSAAKAKDVLQADAQRLALELEIGAGLRQILEDAPASEATDWLREYVDMSLAMAEYLHRHVIGLSQVLSDGLVMRYATGIARTQQQLRAACRRTAEAVAL